MTPLATYRTNWQNCTRCPLHTKRQHIVLGKGQMPCDVLFIGEAPGVSEDVTGIPFDGPAGRLLDDIITKAFEMARMDRLRLAFTNLIACIPLGDDEEGNKNTKLGQPPPDAIKACAPRVIEFTKIAQPKLIVLVGALALKHIPAGVLQAGQWCHIDHPAFLLRVDLSQRGLAIQRNTVTLSDALVEL